MCPKIGFVSTFNVECGISTYSEHLVEHFPEDSTIIYGNKFGTLSNTGNCLNYPIKRCWTRTGTHEDLFLKIISDNLQVVHIQHEFGLFQDRRSFTSFLQRLYSNGIKVYITYHTVFTKESDNNDIYNHSNYIEKMIVHHEDAANCLGLRDKTVVIPHGSMLIHPCGRYKSREHLNIPQDAFVALCLGFITPTKAALDSIDAVVKLHTEFPQLMLYIVGFPVVHHNNYGNLEYCLKLYKEIETRGASEYIKIINRFVPEDELDYFAGAADVAIENYKQTQYSTSGMSHLVMSYGLPSISSRANILADLDDSRSLKYDIGSVDSMINNLRTLITDECVRSSLTANSLLYARQTSWPTIALRHLKLYGVL